MAALERAGNAVLMFLVVWSLRAWAADPQVTAVQGFVADAHGTPVRGALISVFGQGLSGGGLLTFSGEDGRFVLSDVPAGSYTLRAIGRGQRPALARQITVLPNRPAYFSVNLAPPVLETTVGEGAEVTADAARGGVPVAVSRGASDGEALRELRWTLRHRRRSVIESVTAASEVRASQSLASLAPPRPADWGGRLDVLADTSRAEAAQLAAFERPTGVGLLRLDGRLAENVTWSLAGLVAESESTAWRMAAEFVVEPGAGHRLEFGSGYGSGVLRPAPNRREGETGGGGAGALFVHDTLALSPELSAALGVRWAYLGYLRTSHYLDPSGALTWKRGRHTLHVSGTLRTLAPGGDLLALSSLATAPAVSFAVLDEALRAERVTHYELGVQSRVGALMLEARAFREGSRDQLVNLFEAALSDRLRIVNARGGLVSTGVGVTLARRLGRTLSGSLSYSAGVARRAAAVDTMGWQHDVPDAMFAARVRFRDLVVRVETLLNRGDTRLVAYYRVNFLAPDGGVPYASTRFDVQLNQGLAFLGTLTNADWELLLAFRNLFYEDAEGGLLDEVAVHRPPKRIVGGVSVRF